MKTLTQDGDSYLHNGNKLYGRVNSDDTVCKQVQRLRDIKETKHINSMWYISCRNIVKVRFNGVYRDMESLIERFPQYDVNVPLAV